MPRKKKEVELFTVKDGQVLIEEKNIDNLTENDSKRISFYAKTLGFEVVLIPEPPKSKKTFTIKKAEEYIKINDKKNLKQFKSFKDEANKLAEAYKSLMAQYKDENNENKPSIEDINKARITMINAQREAFKNQKEWFIDKFGKDGYDDVKEM